MRNLLTLSTMELVSQEQLLDLRASSTTPPIHIVHLLKICHGPRGAQYGLGVAHLTTGFHNEGFKHTELTLVELWRDTGSEVGPRLPILFRFCKGLRPTIF